MPFLHYNHDPVDARWLEKVAADLGSVALADIGAISNSERCVALVHLPPAGWDGAAGNAAALAAAAARQPDCFFLLVSSAPACLWNHPVDRLVADRRNVGRIALPFCTARGFDVRPEVPIEWQIRFTTTHDMRLTHDLWIAERDPRAFLLDLDFVMGVTTAANTVGRNPQQATDLALAHISRVLGEGSARAFHAEPADFRHALCLLVDQWKATALHLSAAV